jgi:hypothetical protein
MREAIGILPRRAEAEDVVAEVVEGPCRLPAGRRHVLKLRHPDGLGEELRGLVEIIHPVRVVVESPHESAGRLRDAEIDVAFQQLQPGTIRAPQEREGAVAGACSLRGFVCCAAGVDQALVVALEVIGHKRQVVDAELRSLPGAGVEDELDHAAGELQIHNLHLRAFNGVVEDDIGVQFPVEVQGRFDVLDEYSEVVEFVDYGPAHFLVWGKSVALQRYPPAPLPRGPGSDRADRLRLRGPQHLDERFHKAGRQRTHDGHDQHVGGGQRRQLLGHDAGGDGQARDDD